MNRFSNANQAWCRKLSSLCFVFPASTRLNVKIQNPHYNHETTCVTLVDIFRFEVPQQRSMQNCRHASSCLQEAWRAPGLFLKSQNADCNSNLTKFTGKQELICTSFFFLKQVHIIKSQNKSPVWSFKIKQPSILYLRFNMTKMTRSKGQRNHYKGSHITVCGGLKQMSLSPRVDSVTCQRKLLCTNQ